MKSFKKGLIWIKQHPLEVFLLVVILGLASFARLYRISEYMTFLGDEGRDVLVVKRMIVDGKLTLLGPTASVGGFFLGPVYYYLMAPFLFLYGLDPVGPAVMVGLFGVATVFLVYKTGRDFFDSQVGLVAAFFYAISPLIITYSRASWNPNLMPFFSLLIIYLLRRAVVEKKYYLLGVVGFLFGITFQLHYLAVFLLAVVLVYLFLFAGFRKLCRPTLKGLFLAVVGFVLGLSPFLAFEIRHNFPNSRSLHRFIFFGEETGLALGNFFDILGDVSFRLFSRIVTHNQEWLVFLLLPATLVLLLFTFLRSKKDRERFLTLGLLVCWFVVGVVLFGFYQKGIYDYYFSFLYPLPFLLSAWLIVFLAKKKIFGFPLALGFFLALSWANLRGWPFRFEPNNQLRQARTVAESVLEKTEGKPFNFALITSSNSDHAFRYFFEINDRKPVTIQNPQIDPERKTVTDQLLVICETLPCAPEGHSLWEIAGFGRAQIVEKWSVSVVEVYKLAPYQEDENK